MGAPATKGEEIFETLTELLYSDGQAFWGYEACNMWGNNLHREGTRIQWFKLLLDEDERRRHEAQFMFSQLENLGLTISDAITDYLTFLLTHTKSELRIHNRYCDDCTIQLVLTVPNVWSARASSTMVHSMESAAKDLSFGHRSEVFLVSEADAAATYFCEKIPDLVLHVSIHYPRNPCSSGLPTFVAR